MNLFRHLTVNEEKLASFDFRRELSMQAYLIENAGVLALDSDIFSEAEILQEELTLKEGRKSKDTDGRIDLLITYPNEYIGVVELKIGELTSVHLEQLEDYLQDAQKKQILQAFPNIVDTEITPNPKWIGLLVGSSICPELAHKISKGYFLPNGVSIAALTIKRFRSESGNVYVTTDVHFKNPSLNRDTTKYNFEGTSYGKGKLVLAVLKHHVAERDEIDFSELEKHFPKKLQGSSGVFSSIEMANRIYEDTNRKRHFLKQEELIKLADSTIAVSNQWGIGNIDQFIDEARELGHEIIKV